jgi:hypothetical protein
MPRGNPPLQNQSLPQPVAGSGLLDRRVFLTQSIALLGAGGLAVATTLPAHAADPALMSPWMQFAGAGRYHIRRQSSLRRSRSPRLAVSCEAIEDLRSGKRTIG